MKKNKTVFILGLLLFGLMTLGATEARVKALTGNVEEGALLVSDSWCEPFYVSPSLALMYSDTFFWVKDRIMMNIPLQGSYDRESEYSHKVGLFYSRDRFRFLFDYNFSTGSYGNSSSSFIPEKSSQPGYEYSTSYWRVFLGGDLLFAWQLSEGLSLGFKLGAHSLVYEYYSKDQSWGGSLFSFSGDRSYERYLVKPLFNLTINENLGLTIDRERFTATFAIPFLFDIQDRQTKSKKSGSKPLFKRYSTYQFTTSFRVLTDFKLKKGLVLRLNNQFDLAWSRQGTGVSNGEFTLWDSKGEAEYRQTFALGGMSSLTINHYLKSERHLLYYGLNLKTTHHLNWRGEQGLATVGALDWGMKYLALDGYFGGEMKPHEKIHILFGLSAKLFRLIELSDSALYTDKLLLPEDVYRWPYYKQFKLSARGLNVFSPMSCDLNFGVNINPVKGFTIELNTNLFRLSPFNVQEEGYRLNFSFDMGFVWNISRLKRNKELREKERSEAANHQGP